MPKIQLGSIVKLSDPILRHDLETIQDQINLQQARPEIDSRSDDPSNLPTSSGKLVMWYRSDLQELRFIHNGTKYKISATAV